MTAYAGRLTRGTAEVRLTLDLKWESNGSPVADEMADYLIHDAFRPPNSYSFAYGAEEKWMLLRAAELMPDCVAEIYPNPNAAPFDLIS